MMEDWNDGIVEEWNNEVSKSEEQGAESRALRTGL